MASADFSRTLILELSPSKDWVFPLVPPDSTLHIVGDSWASPALAGSPHAPGLAIGSYSCGRGFAFRFLQLHLTATPCGLATVVVTSSVKYFST